MEAVITALKIVDRGERDKHQKAVYCGVAALDRMFVGLYFDNNSTVPTAVLVHMDSNNFGKTVNPILATSANFTLREAAQPSVGVASPNVIEVRTVSQTSFVAFSLWTNMDPRMYPGASALDSWIAAEGKRRSFGSSAICDNSLNTIIAFTRMYSNPDRTQKNTWD